MLDAHEEEVNQSLVSQGTLLRFADTPGAATGRYSVSCVGEKERRNTQYDLSGTSKECPKAQTKDMSHVPIWIEDLLPVSSSETSEN